MGSSQTQNVVTGDAGRSRLNEKQDNQALILAKLNVVDEETHELKVDSADFECRLGMPIQEKTLKLAMRPRPSKSSQTPRNESEGPTQKPWGI